MGRSSIGGGAITSHPAIKTVMKKTNAETRLSVGNRIKLFFLFRR